MLKRREVLTGAVTTAIAVPLAWVVPTTATAAPSRIVTDDDRTVTERTDRVALLCWVRGALASRGNEDLS